MFLKIHIFLSSNLFRPLWRYSQNLRDFWRFNNCFNLRCRLDSSTRRSRAVQKSADECWMQLRESSKSWNAFCDWLDCASGSSKVSLKLFFKDFDFFQTNFGSQSRRFGESIAAAYRRKGLWKWRCHPIWNLAIKRRKLESNRRTFAGLKKIIQ